MLDDDDGKSLSCAQNTAKVSQHEQVVHPSQQTPISRYHVPRRKFDGAPSSQTARSKLQQLPPGRGRATNTVLEDDDDLSEDETYHDQHDDSPSSSNAEEEEQLRLPRKPGKMVLSVVRVYSNPVGSSEFQSDVDRIFWIWPNDVAMW